MPIQRAKPKFTDIKNVSIATSTLPAGSVIQVVSTQDSSPGDSYTTNDYIEVLSTTITPQFSNSKIYISYQIGIGGQTKQPMSSRIKRDSTVVGSNVLSGGTARYGNSATNAGSPFSAADQITMLHGQFLDSPSTTSATAYKIEVSPRNEDGNKTFVTGEPHNQVNDGYIFKTNNIITLMEIKV